MKSIPPSDVNIFPEYILPGLAHITQDEAVIVRTAYAENIAHLAHIALRYLENAHLSNLGNKEGPKPSYDSELQTLHEMVIFYYNIYIYNIILYFINTYQLLINILY